LAARSSKGDVVAAGVAADMVMEHSEVALEEHIVVGAQSSTSADFVAIVKVVGRTCDVDHAQMERLRTMERPIEGYGMRWEDTVARTFVRLP
jgi:hypothetical protein